ncbi:MAG: LysR family transcriptional regulator [Elusimicrobia bacterium]|nr:LysR family transcriptional regulator [Elusimicrobiota bacterium]
MASKIMMRSITLRQLEVFYETAALSSLSRAAEKLHLTQSAASMALAQFEAYAGGPVFTRLGRGLQLNDRGERLFPEAARTLESYDRFLSACEDNGPLKGRVCVGASTTIANYCLPELLGKFTAKYPGAEVSLRVGNTDEMAALLRAGEADFAVVEGEVSGGDILLRNWRRDELEVLTHPSHRLAGRKTVRLAELACEKWILREQGSGTLSTLQNVLSASGLRLQHVREIGHTEAIKRAVEGAMGISCLSALAVRREAIAGSLAVLKLSPPLYRWFSIITVRDRYQSRVSKALQKWLAGK